MFASDTAMNKKSTPKPKDPKIKEALKDGGRDNAKKDFFELLKRASRPVRK
jgi:hypothetical protein